jgi:hypothetical protein
MVDLHPAGAAHSYASGTNGAQQVGRARFGTSTHAGLWNGSASSWVNLHPAGAGHSYARSTTGSQQVGAAYFNNSWQAGLWSGSAASWVSLHPEGASESHGYGTSGAQQVGFAQIDAVTRASLWRGWAGSWVDLHPAGATGSEAWGTNGSEQVGLAWFSGRKRASLWTGTAASWVDLHALLPGGSATWRQSEAHSVWRDGSVLYVAGYGQKADTFYTEALLWTWTPPPAANVSGSVGLGGWTAPLTGRPVTFEVRAPGSTTALQTAVVNLSAAGEFTFTTALPAGTYDVTAKSDRWLRARLQNVAFTAAGVSGLAFGELIPGDVVEDNAVDLGDFLALAATYEVVPPTEARADLNGDGAVDVADFLLLAAHYETVGAP